MDTTNKRTNKQILAVIGSSLLTLIFLFFAGATKASPSPASTTAAIVNFTGLDTASQGTWRGKYGADGYSIANDSQSLPSYASFAAQNQSNWTWTGSTSDPRALQSGASAGRVATAWYSPSTFYLDVNLTDGNSHQIAVYAVDWDAIGRSETIQVVDANSNAVLDTRPIPSFTSGVYLMWNITGHVRITASVNAGSNTVISAVFFAPAAISTLKPSVASFAGLDQSTQGTWRGKYGADGYSIANDSQSLPSYASFAAQNQSNWTWAGSTSDLRALQSGASAGRMAATWYNSSTFDLDVNLTDGNSHQIAVYAVDWDAIGRSETIQVVDANSNAVLDTRPIPSFTSGVYLVWNITGHVRITASMNAGSNAVISAVFFGGAATTVGGGIAPAITAQPASASVTAGQTATFSVANTGTAPMAYQWQKNGVAIGGATASSDTTPVAAASDNGSQYTVVVSNGFGSVTSSAATLTVSAGTLILNSSSTSLNFGNVNVSSSSAQSVTFTNTGTGSVTISNVSASGAGFNASGVSAGTILASGQTATLNATFAPAASGNVTGSIVVSSNATGGAKTVALAGAGVAVPVPHSVVLAWAPSTSTVVGYNVYVSTVSGSSYVKLSASPNGTDGYTDSGLQTAQTRYYVVTSVDSNNDESAFSNQVTAIVP